MLIDVHAHYDETPHEFEGHGGAAFTMPQTELPSLRAAMAESQIGGMLLFAGLADILNAPKTASGLFQANERLSFICEATKDTFASYLLIHPTRLAESIEVITRHHGDPFVVGVGEILPSGHFNGHPFDTTEMVEIARCAAKHGLPMNFHTGDRENVRQLGWLIEKVPDGVFILAHAAGEAVNEGLDLMEKHPGVWMDLSVHAWKPGVREPLVERADRRRLLFGSDFPIESPSAAVDHFRQIGFSEDEMTRIAEINPFVLFPKLRRIFSSFDAPSR